MILTFPVLVYQLLFVLLMFLGSRLGPRVHALTLALCLLWTATHLFFWPLALLQTLVIVASYAFFRRKAPAVEREIDR